MLDLNSNWTMGQCVLHWAKTTPDAVAVKSRDDSLTYRELAELAARYAEWLQSYGIQRGMIIGINLKHHITNLLLVLATQSVGAVPMFVATSDLSNNQLVNRCALLIVEDQKLELGSCKHVIALDQTFLNRIAAMPPQGMNILSSELRPGEVAIVFTSSGTTANSKYIPISQASLRSRFNARINEHILKNAMKNVVSTMPFSASAGMQWGGAALFVGGHISWEDAETIAERTSKGCDDNTMIIASPFVAQMLVERCRLCSSAPFIRLLSFAGAEPSLELIRDVLRFCAKEIQVSYSCAEVSMIAVGQAGQPKTILPGVEVRLVNNTGVEVAAGASGFIELRSERAATSYLWNPELTQKHFVNGWFRTFDVGYMPEAGKLVVLGRGDDVLNIGGVKIAPQPIEDKIKALSGVTDAVLLALPSAAGIEGLHVVIERADPSLDARLIDQAQQLIPEGTFQGHFVDKMPRTETGKVQRNVLRDLLLRHMQAATPTRH